MDGNLWEEDEEHYLGNDQGQRTTVLIPVDLAKVEAKLVELLGLRLPPKKISAGKP